MSTSAQPAAQFRAIHAFGLAAFAWALPLFLVMAEGPEFFFAHGFSPSRTLMFALALGWGIPLAVSVVVAAGNATRHAVGRGVGWGVAGILAVFAFLPTLNRLTFFPGSVSLVLAFVGGAALVYGYAHRGVIRELFTLLAILAVAYPLWFAWKLDVFVPREAPVVSALTRDDGAEGASSSATDSNAPPVIWL